MTVITKPEMGSQEDYAIRRFRDADATGVVRCFKEVYGDHYVSDLVYNPAFFVKANRDGKLHSFVARDGSEQVVGHLALVQTAPHRALLEIAQGVVLAEHRRGGLFNRMIERVMFEADNLEDCFGIYGTSLCNHIISQRALYNFGFRGVGYEVDYVPPRLFAKEQSAQGCVATLLQHCKVRNSPQVTTYLPEPFAEKLAGFIISRGDSRDFRVPAKSLSNRGDTQAVLNDMPRFDMTRLNVERAGQDLGERLGQIEAEARNQGRAMVQALVDLGDPESGAMVAILRDLGFWFGCLLPRWSGSDAFMMQKSLGTPNFDAIRIYTDEDKRLLNFVHDDYSATVAEGVAA